MEDLHRISRILNDRETIDRAQFLRLLEGEAEESIWPPEPEAAPAPVEPAARAARWARRPPAGWAWDCRGARRRRPAPPRRTGRRRSRACPAGAGRLSSAPRRAYGEAAPRPRVTVAS
jgi:hypothetical protein